MRLKLILSGSIAALMSCISQAADINEPESILNKKNDINGTVSSYETKQPVKYVSVIAYLLSKKEKTIVTDESGNYAFNELRPGTYKIVFEKTGYKKVIKDKVLIKSDEAFQMDIEMADSPDFELIPAPTHFSEL